MKKILLGFGISAFVASTVTFAIDTKLSLNVADHFSIYAPIFDNPNDKYRHLGLDYMLDTATKLKALSFGKIVFRNNMITTHTCETTICSGKPDHGMGRVLEVEHLLTNGKQIYSSFNHLNSFPNYSIYENYVVPSQTIAYSGDSGQQSNTYWVRRYSNSKGHLHLEIKESPREEGISNLTSPWGYTSRRASDYGYLNPSNYLEKTYVSIPFLSQTNSTPSNLIFFVGGSKNSTS